MAGLIEKLNGLIDQETELVRAGHVRKATALTAAKSGLAAELYAAGERLKANRDFLLRTVPAAAHALHSPGRLSRRAATKHDRDRDRARGVRGNRAAAFGRHGT